MYKATRRARNCEMHGRARMNHRLWLSVYLISWTLKPRNTSGHNKDDNSYLMFKSKQFGVLWESWITRFKFVFLLLLSLYRNIHAIIIHFLKIYNLQYLFVKHTYRHFNWFNTLIYWSTLIYFHLYNDVSHNNFINTL